ncbi:hypothetical protein KEM56_003690 [Ascosphaera pollenicola]|nr:hypothetical protein KEM56_003690 [Ascosphaera pollenicola]
MTSPTRETSTGEAGQGRVPADDVRDNSERLNQKQLCEIVERALSTATATPAKRKGFPRASIVSAKRTAKDAFYRAPLPDLVAHHIPQCLRDFSFTLPEPSSSNGCTYEIEIHDNTTIPSGMFEACFRLVEFTCAETYKRSSFGWSASGKKKEMADEDMRFLVLARRGRHKDKKTGARDSTEFTADDVHSDSDTVWGEKCPRIGGFLSFMVTKEAGLPIIYVYEIHLHPMLQGRNIGSKLLSFIDFIGSSLNLNKVMLTTFKKNEGAIRFYRRHGFEEDESSPKSRRLRNGKVKEWDYMIMSKELRPRSDGKQSD